MSDFCGEKGYTFRIAKDTDTVKRYMVDYGGKKDGNEKKLKIEISYRRKTINENEKTVINGIHVYTIEAISIMKANAYSSRDKIRDLYDVSFIVNHYWDSLSEAAQSLIKSCIEYKGIEQFDYLVNQYDDDLIDVDKLAEDFLSMYDKLDLLATEEERKIISEYGDVMANVGATDMSKYDTYKKYSKNKKSKK